MSAVGILVKLQKIDGLTEYQICRDDYTHATHTAMLSDVEGIAGEINEQQIVIDRAYEQTTREIIGGE